MRNFILIVSTGLGLMLAAPRFAAATPFSGSSGLAAAAEQMGGPEEVRHRRWHRHYRWHRWHRRHPLVPLAPSLSLLAPPLLERSPPQVAAEPRPA
jgi:hypothetical protein